MNLVLFSVIIPTFKRNDLLKECLHKLLIASQNLQNASFEILVTDDSPEVQSRELQTEFPSVKFLKGPGKGPASNRNSAAYQATGEWLLFIDDDCFAEENLLSVYKKNIERHPECNAFEGAILPLGVFPGAMVECPVNVDGNCFWSANICIKKSLFYSLKGFDENFRIAAQEDQDIFLRIKENHIIIFLRNAEVFHPVRSVNWKKEITTIKERARSWAYYMQKNKNRLGIKNDFGVITYGYYFHLHAMVRNLFAGWLLKSFLILFFTIIGLPLVVLYLLKHHHQFPAAQIKH